MPAKKQMVVGKIGKTFGIHGWLKILSYLENNTDLLKFRTWSLEVNHHHRQYQLEASKIHGSQLIVKFEGINTPEDAQSLTGSLIYLSRDEFPALAKNEYYWSDLEGLAVINKDQQVLGIVKEVIGTGSNDVLIVKGTKELAIPYLPGTVILKIDLTEKKIYVDWELL